MVYKNVLDPLCKVCKYKNVCYLSNYSLQNYPEST